MSPHMNLASVAHVARYKLKSWILMPLGMHCSDIAVNPMLRLGELYWEGAGRAHLIALLLEALDEG